MAAVDGRQGAGDRETRRGCNVACAAQTQPPDGMRLPTLLPMLATPSDPFDSPDYRFETKWDGVRALAAVDATGWRLWGRDAADYTSRYPDLAVLRRLPPGTLVDGELVAK